MGNGLVDYFKSSATQNFQFLIYLALFFIQLIAFIYFNMKARHAEMIKAEVKKANTEMIRAEVEMEVKNAMRKSLRYQQDALRVLEHKLDD